MCMQSIEVVKEKHGPFIDTCKFYKEIKDDLLIHSFYYTLRKLQFNFINIYQLFEAHSVLIMLKYRADSLSQFMESSTFF